MRLGLLFLMLLKHAAHLIVAPAVAGGMGASQLRFLDDYFATGGGRNADVLAYHGYVYPAEDQADALQQIRALAVSHGLGAKPIWNTETGTDLSAVSEADTAAYLAQTLISEWAHGVKRVYIYAYHGSFTGLDAPVAGSKKRDPSRLGLSCLAYTETMQRLTGARMLSCASDTHGTWTCRGPAAHTPGLFGTRPARARSTSPLLGLGRLAASKSARSRFS